MDKIINETQSVQSTTAASILRTSPTTHLHTSISPLSTVSIAAIPSSIFSSTNVNLHKLIIEQKPDIVQKSVKNNSLRNKRKNFNPRCSALNDNNVFVADKEMNDDKPFLAKGNANYSLHERSPVLDSREGSPLLSGYDEDNRVDDYNNDKKHCSTALTSNILKNWQSLFELQAQLSSKEPLEVKSLHADVGERCQKGDIGRYHINQSQQHIAAEMTSSIDRQFKNDFTCNAFNAVQELLNVYGLSISPGDIVDAFKIQQQQLKKHGDCQQPPTPPRTPTSALQASSTLLATPIASFSEISDQKDDDDNQQLQQNLPEVSSEEKEDFEGAHSCSSILRNMSRKGSPVAFPKSISGAIEQGTISKSQASNDEVNCRGRRIKVSSENNNSNDEFVVHDSLLVSNGDYSEASENQQVLNHQRHLHREFADRFDDSSLTNLYDVNHGYNDNDSNVSSIMDDDHASSDDVTLGGDSAIFGENRRSGEGSTGGDDEGDNDQRTTSCSDVSQLAVKNVDNLLEKCSLNIFSPILQLAQIQNDDKHLNAEYMNYLTKFSSYHQCKTNACQVENLREHYHCYDIPCLGKVFNKKEEVIRHLKWHKKRAESLNHGFLRFSSSDDCSLAFNANCTHNRKQTHYHCFQPNCDKVYISTSDVQMHSNYHRKDSAIYQEGFQRYRATEECHADYCIFAGQRTTHFHCRRDNCRYTFKNKADMEKHKSYHIKDLQLARDGFKKFLKTESCPYERCRFSRICNHIHCVRENCHYVLHSSGQLLSHKRKHERMDSEQAYRRFKMVQKAAAAAAVGIVTSASSSNASGTVPSTPSGALGYGTESKPSTPSTSSSKAISPDLHLLPDYAVSLTTSKSLKHEPILAGHVSNAAPHPKLHPPPLDVSLLYGSSGLPLDMIQKLHLKHQQMLSAGVMGNVSTDDSKFAPSSSAKHVPITGSSALPAMLPPPLHTNVLTRSAMEEIEELVKQYFTSNCTRQPASMPHHLDQTEPLNLKSSASGTSSAAGGSEKVECHASTPEPHLHCLFKNCDAVVLRNLVDVSEHMQVHELNRNAENVIQDSNLLQITSIEGFFNRKRGRPPKNRVVEVYNNARNQSPQAIFTSFKLEKTLSDPLAPSVSTSINQPRQVSTISSTITSQSANLLPSYADTSAAQAASISLSTFIVTGRVQVFNSDAHKCCDSGNNGCPMVQELHFHCKFTMKCNFYTNDPLTMEQHVAEEHVKISGDGENESTVNTTTAAKNWQHYASSTDCFWDACIHRRKYNHFHCRSCDYTTDIESEIEHHTTSRSCNHQQCEELSAVGAVRVFCNEAFHSLLNNNNNDGFSNESVLSTEDGDTSIKPEPLSNTDDQRRDDKMFLTNFKDRSANEAFKAESSHSCSPIKAEPSSNEDEKVSVVRAAGTYFPQNSNSSNDIELAQLVQLSDPATQADYTVNSTQMCHRPFCKLKRKPHRHCNMCNQAFSDSVKLEIHRLKHSTLMLSDVLDATEKDVLVTKDDENPEHQSSAQDNCKAKLSSPNASAPLNYSGGSAAMTAAMSSSTGLSPIIPQGFADNLSIQNLHLAHLALYQQNPFYYQSFYPFLRSHNLPTAFATHSDLLQVQLAVAAATSNGNSTNNEESSGTKHLHSPLKAADESTQGSSYPFSAANVAPVTKVNANTISVVPSVTPNLGMSPQSFELTKLSHNFLHTIGRRKRKAEEYDGSPHELLEMSIGSATNLATAGAAKKIFKGSKQGNFKIFKDEPIPHGYLKFRFNEDCNFPNCGYRNHQSHFHCCRKDCYYSFCDKTRFVQHTARHERLDKLMGDDFKQYRANMRCGYEECVYNKNLAGQNNKSSHFHCLKCNFICSDTNKVVAHRRQHSKMEFIRMAGFRKVANNEKCNAHKAVGSSTTALHTSNDQPESDNSTDKFASSSNSGGGSECTYSLKQTHYHCLVCDCSVLSRAQLGSHRHRMQ